MADENPEKNGEKSAEVVGELTLVPGYGSGTFPVVYSNFASISRTKEDLCIDFCLVAPPHRIDLDKKLAQIPVVARVLIPTDMSEGLINALKEQAKRVLDKGKIVIPGQKRKSRSRSK